MGPSRSRGHGRPRFFNRPSLLNAGYRDILSGCLFFVDIFPSRKTAFFLDADLKNSFSSRKTPLFMDKARHINSSIRKNPCFTDGTFKFPNLIRNLAEFTDRTTLPHPMNDLGGEELLYELQIRPFAFVAEVLVASEGCFSSQFYHFLEEVRTVISYKIMGEFVYA